MSRTGPPAPPPPPPAKPATVRAMAAAPSSAAAPPLATPPRVPAQAARVGAGLRQARLGLRGTPGRLRLVSAALVLVGLVVGFAAAQSFSAADAALERATANAAQVVRLQDIQTSLVRADADATNAFLLGGLEPADLRTDYQDAIDHASGTIALAAAAQPADGAALAALTTSLVHYTDAVAVARSNNRQGFPVGAQYLRIASAGLRADALPIMDALQTANEDRAQAEFTAARRAGTLALVAAGLGLVAVALALVWLARLTHRIVNVPLAGAGLVVVVVLALAAVVLGTVAQTVDRVRDGPYAAARALSDARVAAFDAKSNESLTLVSRGSGQAYEAAWVASAEVTAGRLSDAIAVGDTFAAGAPVADLADAWDAYARAHTEIRALDDGGQWEDAVAAATSREPGSANAAFEAFDDASAARLGEASDRVATALHTAASTLTLWAWLGVLAGLATAALAWWGLAQRIEEYR